MPKLRNEEYWSEIKQHAAFSDPPKAYKDKCWMWLERLQEAGARRIKAHDLIILKALIDAVYDAGRQAAFAEAAEAHLHDKVHES
jgi:hypothetical protein